jgi:kumamolisin
LTLPTTKRTALFKKEGSPSMSRHTRRLAVAGCLALSAAAAALPATAGAQSSSKSFDVLLQLSTKPGLSQFVRQVSDPDSRHYRQYLTVDQLIKRFGSTKQTKQKTKRWARAHGAAVTIDKTGLFATLTTTPAQASRLFGDGRAVAAAAHDTTTAHALAVPDELEQAVRSVSTLPVHAFETAQSAAPGSPVPDGGSARTRSGTPAGCPAGQNATPGRDFLGFTPNQYMTAYGHQTLRDRGLSGKGISVGVLEIDGYNPADLQVFADCFGVKLPRITPHAVGMKDLLPPGDETTMDLELLSTVAPGVDGIDVYEGPLLATLAHTASSEKTRPDVLSLSLDGCENYYTNGSGSLRVLDSLFALLAAAGTSTFVATGDQGSTPCRNADQQILPIQGATYPSTSRFVTAVAATNVVLNPDNTLQQQFPWNNAPGQASGTSGSASLFWPRPWYQNKWGAKPTPNTGTTRVTPDLAALGDVIPGYALYCTAIQPGGGCNPPGNPQGGWITAGGTSAATPLTAGAIVLANEAAARRGQAPLGLINPLLYKLAASKASDKIVWDVTTGSNDLGTALPAPISNGQPIGCCSAGQGYDEVSGWGSLKVAAFSDAALAYGTKTR